MRLVVQTLAAAVALAVGGGAILTSPGRAAPKPVPEPSAEERELRALVQPLRDGLTEGEQLRPLLDWIAARTAAGRSRDSERDLRRVLKRIDQDLQTDLLNAAKWVQTLSHQRAELYEELSGERIGLPRAVEQYHEFLPVPSEEELLPMRAELPDWISPATGAPTAHTDAATGASSLEGAEAEEAPEPAASEIDASRLLNQLTADLTSLRHLLHACDNEYEGEKKRHRQALELLAELFKSRPAPRGKKPAPTK